MLEERQVVVESVVLSHFVKTLEIVGISCIRVSSGSPLHSIASIFKPMNSIAVYGHLLALSVALLFILRTQVIV